VDFSLAECKGLPAERSHQAAGRTIPGFQTVCRSLVRRVQTVYDLIEKLWPENDLVYELTEIDNDAYDLNIRIGGPSQGHYLNAGRIPQANRISL
jgi:hypothetical protein